MAGSLPVIVRSTWHSLVADVAELCRALFTRKQILASTFAIDRTACGTLATELNVDVWVLCHAHIALDHLKSDLDRLECAFIAPMIGLLFKVFLAFCRVHAFPAKPSPALCALDLGAPATCKCNPGATLTIGASFGAVLDIQLIKTILNNLVLVCDFFHLLGKLSEQIQTMDKTPLKWMHMLFAVQAEMEIAMIASTRIITLDAGYRATSGHRTPAHVIHGLNS